MVLANLRGITCFISTVQIFPDSVQAGMKEHFKQSFLAKTRVIISWDCLFVDEVRLKWIIVKQIVETCTRKAVILGNGGVCVCLRAAQEGKRKHCSRS